MGREDPLEKGMATHSSTRAWRIPWTEEPGGLPSMGSQRDTTEHTFIQDILLTVPATRSWPKNPSSVGAPAPFSADTVEKPTPLMTSAFPLAPLSSGLCSMTQRHVRMSLSWELLTVSSCWKTRVLPKVCKSVDFP